MSIPFSGCRSRSAGVVEAIWKQLKVVNLKAVQRITVKFDPFHDKTSATRKFLFYLTLPKVAQQAPNCSVRTEIVCDRQDPTVSFKLLPDIAEQAGTEKITFKSVNLSCLELLQICNKHITPLAPKEQVTTILKTKSEKKSAGGRR